MVKRLRHMAVVAAASAALALFGQPLCAASASATPSSPSSSSVRAALAAMPRHYSVEAPQVHTVGQDQCGRPAAKRTGRWVCPGTGPHQAQKRSSVTPDSENETCSAFGCWDYVNTAKAEFFGDGAYGYGGSILGYTTFRITLTWSGGDSKSKPFRFESTRGVRNLEMSGERIYFSSKYPQGHPAEGGDTYQVFKAGNVNANTAKDAWTNGYAHYAKKVDYGGVAHQYQWEDGEVDGTWWTYVNSPKFASNSSGAYKCSNPPKMGTDWYGSGYDKP